MRAVLYLLPLLLMTGCMNVDYVGKKFPATEHVSVFKNREEMPQDKYTIIGRFTVRAEQKKSPYIVEEEILERAAKYGGDAICLTAVKVERYGNYNSEDQEFGSFPTHKRVQPENEKQFGKGKPLASTLAFAERNVYQYLLLKENSKLKLEDAR